MQIHVDAVWYNLPPQVLVGSVQIRSVQIPSYKDAFLAFSSPQILLPLSPEVSPPQLRGQSVIIDPTPPHTSAALPHPLLWVLRNEIPISSDTQSSVLLSPKLLLS